jgi:hypothetical protein
MLAFEYTDFEIGRLIQHLKKLDSTTTPLFLLSSATTVPVKKASNTALSIGLV